MPVRTRPVVMRERELQHAVIDLSRLLGYRVAHFRAAQTGRGWRTPVQADGAGFPDLVLAGNGRVIFAELKAGRGGVRRAQADWLAELFAAGAEAYVWRPADWRSGDIERTLRTYPTERRTAP